MLPGIPTRALSPHPWGGCPFRSSTLPWSLGRNKIEFSFSDLLDDLGIFDSTFLVERGSLSLGILPSFAAISMMIALKDVELSYRIKNLNLLLG